MRSRLLHACAAVLLPLALFGCQQDNPWTASLDRSYNDPIQRLVEDRITERSESLSGAERWERYKADEYQGADCTARDPVRVRLELKRREQAGKLMEAGPLSLADCLANSLEFSDRIQAGRAAVRAIGGQELIAKSRFLPRLSYDLTASVVQNIGQQVANGARAGMTLLEFGKDNPIDVVLRAQQRRALFLYEQDVADVLSAVRVRFFTILVKKRQLSQRRKLRDEFAARYDRMVKLEAQRRVLEVDVLTAKLNVLNEQMRINSLEKEIQRQKIDLLHAVGFPVGMTEFTLQGRPEAYALSRDESVDIALRRSTRIAQARAVVFERDRVVRQSVWEYLPHVNTRGGYRGEFGLVGADLVSDDSVYSGGAFARRPVDPWNSGPFSTNPDWLAYDGSGWYWDMDMELLLFSGFERTGKFKRDKALLDQDRHLLCNTIAETELAVAKAYQTVLERARQTDILRETAAISQERLRVQERFKELARITDNELETFRERFFEDQDRYFEGQIQLIEAQERLRLAMRYFDPASEQGDEE